MVRPCILIADNDSDFLDTRAEFFDDHYDVVKAYSVEEARVRLQTSWVHLAILDLRLTDDDDGEDKSGLMLAREAPSSTPKIILTGYPTASLVREAFRDIAVVDFLYKTEGPEAMLQAVENAFANHVRINWELNIQFNNRELGSFVHLVSLVEPQLERAYLSNRTEELTDLFRRLFFEKQKIRITRLLWKKDDRIALSVFAFKEEAPQEAFVVVCGANATVKTEVQNYRNAAPKASDNLNTSLSMTAETTHFAANAYLLAGANLEAVQSLKALFRVDSEKPLQAALTSILQKTLPAWHQTQSFRKDGKRLATVYREGVSWPQTSLRQMDLKRRVDALLSQFSVQNALQGVQLDRSSGSLNVQFYEQKYTYPDPLPFFFQDFDLEQPVLLINTPGELSGDNILVDVEGRIWLTDFAHAGKAPVLWNSITLEAALRFDWLETVPFQWCHALEQRLTNGDFARLDTTDLEAPVRKVVGAVQLIRKAAAPTVGSDPSSYHLEMLFQATSRLLQYDQSLLMTANELARFVHVLVAASMLCSKLSSAKVKEKSGIQIDKSKKVVMIEGFPIRLSPKAYELLLTLYEHANRLCERKDIFERVFELKYDETNTSLGGRLDTAIRRLREKIEIDPSHPQYILTEERGYRLIPRPNNS
ncbi:MAG: DNA-binding response regulator [Deltaproteobacteria bacterium]|nr:DNA-binding response regulator [Deltaproteobacteria bacterium]